jgi:hypothetical protein
MHRWMTASHLRRRWLNQDEVALLDVREEGPFAEATLGHQRACIRGRSQAADLSSTTIGDTCSI